MVDLDILLEKYRMPEDPDDRFDGEYRLNRLYGLHDLIKENLNSNSIVCELGSHVGASSSLFAYYCKHVYCIDLWSFVFWEAFFIEATQEFDNITKIKSTTNDAVKMFEDNFFDFVYIDAAHDYQSVKDDIINWSEKVKPGGILGGHDFSKADTGVRQAVIELLGQPDKVYEDSSWIKKL